MRTLPIVLLLAACARSTPPAPPAAPPAQDSSTPPQGSAARTPAPPGATGIPLYVDMVGFHWTLTVEARDALLRGEIGLARERLAALGTHEVNPGLPDDWKMTAYQMKAAAHEANAARTSGALGVALGQTVRQCGACHTTAGVRFEAPTEAPPDGADVPTHMRRHAWAVDTLWMSFVAGEPDLWSKGLDALREPPLPTEALAPPDDRQAAAAAMSRFVHTLEEDGREAKTDEERAVVFGELVATCADCHLEAGVKP